MFFPSTLMMQEKDLQNILMMTIQSTEMKIY